MKKLVLSLLAMGLAAFAANAAISIQPSGSGVLTLPSRPAAADWASMTVAGADTAWGTTADVITGVGALDQSAITTQPVDGAGAAQPTQNANALWTSFGGGYLVTRPTGNVGTVLKATLQNNSGGDLNQLRVMYTFGRLGTARTEQVNGQEVFYSLSGTPGTWVHIPELSGGLTTVSTVLRSNTVTFASPFTAGSTMYFLFADDNASGGTDDGFSIDDISFTPLNAALSVALSSPASQVINASTLNPGSVQLIASPSGANPATSVTFYTNNVPFFFDNAAPFSNTLGGLLPGMVVTVYAKASNATETAYSVTNTITVRDEFIHLTTANVSENFDASLGTSGTQTPVGWFVGAAVPANGIDITVGDGSAGPNANILGWNYGLTGDSDRALGTAPTGTDRNIVVRIQNNTSSAISSFEFRYSGEVWRNYTNVQFGITNFVSFDQGATWVDPSIYWLQPIAAAPPVGAVNGNDVNNRVENVGGIVTPPTPVPPNGVIYIRWYDNNEGGTDGGLAVDDFNFTATFTTFTPTLVITSPTNGNVFAQAAPITITAVPSMANPVTNVVFYRDNLSTVITNDTTSPFSISVNNLTVGSHTLFAVAQDNSGLKATNTATVTVTINPNVLPSVTITNPIAASQYLVGTMITNVAAVFSDSDGGVSFVEFYVNGILRSTRTNSPTTNMLAIDVGDVTAGANTLSAVAVDNAGGRATNSISVTVTNPPGATFVVTNGSDWKYMDNGTNFGATLWQSVGYNDAAWASGPAELGYGDAPGRPERTTVSFGTNANSKYITTYFRKTFNVSSLAGFTDLTLSVLRDDAAVVYINGQQVFITGSLTNDTTVVPITSTTLATNATPDDGVVYYSTNLPTSVLSVGANTIAVEVHQDSITSSDISFDLMLWGNTGVVTGPKLTITRPSATQVTISWGADAAGHTLQSSSSITGPWGNVQSITGAGSITVSSTTGNQFYVIR